MSTKKGSLIAVTVAGAALLVCPALHAKPRPDCSAQNNQVDCSIKVTVTEKENTDTCTLAVAAGQMDVGFPKGVRDKFIYWEILGPQDYVFTDDGIVIEKNVPRDFAKPKKLGCYLNLHRNQQPKEYYYAINVENEDGTISCTLDPKIRNQ